MAKTLEELKILVYDLLAAKAQIEFQLNQATQEIAKLNSEKQVLSEPEEPEIKESD